MKHFSLRSVLMLLVLPAALGTTSCKNKAKTAPDTTTNTPAPTTETPAPVTISPDESLKKGTDDAIKDYPGVTAAVDDGVVTLSGRIGRDRLTKLMQSIHALNPKKINNQLTVN